MTGMVKELWKNEPDPHHFPAATAAEEPVLT